MAIFPVASASAFTIYADAAVGAALLWAKLGNQRNRKVYGLTDLVDALIPAEWARSRMIVQLIVFVAIGTFVTVQVFAPSTGGQAFAAGLGWTAGLTSR